MKQSPFITSAITIFIITWISTFELAESQRRPFQNQRPQFPDDTNQWNVQPMQQPPSNRPTTTPRSCDSIICTTEYNPVCARRNAESRTFNNRCILNRENQCLGRDQQWQVSRLGICAPILATN